MLINQLNVRLNKFKKIIQSLIEFFFCVVLIFFFRKNGQPIFEGRSNRSTNNLIDITQTLQLTKSKRIRVERQTTFEKPENQGIIEEAIQIKSFENPNRLAISFYASPEQQSLVKHTNSTRTSTRVYPSQLDNISTSTRTIEQQTNRSDR